MVRSSFSLLIAVMALVACQNQAAPTSASSAGEPAYAERYPATLASMAAEFEQDEAKIGTESEKLTSFPGELREPKWLEVSAVFERADQAGTRADYVAERDDLERVERFYAQSRDKLRQKVAGAANYAAKQRSCDVELSGTVAGSLDKAFEKELEERLRSHNPAHRYIEDHEEQLGKKNLETLAKQADTITGLSYLARTKLPRAKEELQALIDEEAAVKRTLELQKMQADRTLDDPNSSKVARERAAERSQAAADALARFDADVERAKTLLSDLEKRSEEALERYQKAYDLLQTAVEDKADEAHEKAQAEKEQKLQKAVAKK